MKSLLLSIFLAAVAFGQNGTVAPDGGGISTASRDPFLTKLGATSIGRKLLRMPDTVPTPTTPRFLMFDGDYEPTELEKADFLTALGLHNVSNTSDFQKLRDKKIFLPEMYGAQGNSIVNDDVAVQTALTLAMENGGTLGLLNNYGLINGVRVDKGRITIEGYSLAGWNSSTIDCSVGFTPLGLATTCITVVGPPGPSNASGGIVMRNFGITGDINNYKTTATTIGLHFKYEVGNDVPADCPVISINCQWLNLGIYNENVDSANFANCRICDCHKGIRNRHGINTMISGGVIYDCQEYGVQIEGTSYGVSITGNVMGRSGWDIIHAFSQSCVISGNTFTNDNEGPVTTRNGAIYVVLGGSGSEVNIAGNTFTQKLADGHARRYVQNTIYVNDSDSVHIAANKFKLETTTRPAVQLKDSDDVGIAANLFSRLTQAPIYLDSGNTNVSIVGNIHSPTATITAPEAQLAVTTVTGPQTLTSTTIRATGIPTFAGNSAALEGGLANATIYKTSAGDIKIVNSDPDAAAYFTLVVAQGGTVTPTQRQALHEWISTRKALGVWTRYKRLTLPIWGNANANAIDVVTKTSGTWPVSGTIHSAGYAEGDGIGYFSYNASPASMGLTSTSATLFFLGYGYFNGGFYEAIMGSGSAAGDLGVLEDTLAGNGNLEFYGASTGTPDLTNVPGVVFAVRSASNRQDCYLWSGAGVLTSQGNNAASTTLAGTSLEVWRRGTGSPLIGKAKIGLHGAALSFSGAEVAVEAPALETLWETMSALTVP